MEHKKPVSINMSIALLDWVDEARGKESRSAFICRLIAPDQLAPAEPEPPPKLADIPTLKSGAKTAKPTEPVPPKAKDRGPKAKKKPADAALPTAVEDGCTTCTRAGDVVKKDCPFIGVNHR